MSIHSLCENDLFNLTVIHLRCPILRRELKFLLIFCWLKTKRWELVEFFLSFAFFPVASLSRKIFRNSAKKRVLIYLPCIQFAKFFKSSFLFYNSLLLDATPLL